MTEDKAYCSDNSLPSSFLVNPMTSAFTYWTPRLIFFFLRAAKRECGSNHPSPCNPLKEK